jgi:hypothetical protein
LSHALDAFKLARVRFESGDAWFMMYAVANGNGGSQHVWQIKNAQIDRQKPPERDLKVKDEGPEQGTYRVSWKLLSLLELLSLSIHHV